MPHADTIIHGGRTFEMRPIPDGPSGAWEWRERGHGWHYATTERDAVLMIGGYGRHIDSGRGGVE